MPDWYKGKVASLFGWKVGTYICAVRFCISYDTEKQSYHLQQ